MKLLWVKSDFLHPTTRGGQIRTLEILKRLHHRNEVHYVAFDDPAQPEGVARSKEYCTHAYPVAHKVPPRRSLAFAGQLAAGLISSLPVSVSRYRSAAMFRRILALQAQVKFDAVVCDFLTPAPNVPDIGNAVLFQHNIETAIWRRQVENASTPLHRAYLRLQERRMEAYEGEICRKVKRIIAVSSSDARNMEAMFGVKGVEVTPTGVDIDYFAPPPNTAPATDLIFLGSMDWLPNIDGMRFFQNSIFPLIRKQRPDCTIAIVGRNPTPEIKRFAETAGVLVTGTVADVRPHLWDARLSIVPLRIGGGTRLKIYESMAAGVPVVSTAVGAEGLDVSHPDNIRIADTPEDFAQQCLTLLNEEDTRRRVAEAGRRLVVERFGWENIARHFERLLTS